MFDGPIDEGTVAFRPFLDGLADLITTQEACEYFRISSKLHSDCCVELNR